MTTTTTPPSVGDFYVSSWGYDQTNVDFYRVVGLTPKCVKLQLWGSRIVDGQGPADYVVPGDRAAQFDDWSDVDHGADYWTQQEQVRRVDAPVHTRRPNGDWVTIGDRYAKRWDGRPQYRTALGWGH